MASSTRRFVVASTAIAAMMWLAAPLDAQRGQGRGGQGDRTAPQGAPQRGSQRASPAQPRSAPAPQARQQPAPQRPQAQPPSRPAQVQRPIAPPQRGPQGGQRQVSPREVRPPQSNVGRGGSPSRNGNGPTYQAPRPSQPQPPRSYQAPRGSVQPRVGPSRGYTYGRPLVHVRRAPIFSRPYYTFRPRVSLGFGIHIGYSVAYPFQHYDPFGFYNYRIGVLPGYGTTSRNYSSYYGRVGGLSFDIDPLEAEVFIDGEYVGIAADFSSGQMPLTLNAGRHRVDLYADGFMPVSFDITVVAGQVIPYRGTLPYER